MGWGSRRQPFLGKHVIITGGSAGIGLALAKEFYKQGACLTLIARTKAKLEAAVAEIEQLRQSGPGKGTVAPQPAQRVEFQTADTTVPEQINGALLAAEDSLGPVDYLVCNAGAAHPGYFHEQDLSVFEHTMRLNYLGTVATIKGLYGRMVGRGSGHVVIVASALALMGIVGYTSYAPSKFALKGLADCLRSELLGSGVRVSIAYPPDTDTPGLQNENQTKPADTKEISVLSEVFSAEQVAQRIVRGVERGNYTLYGPDGPLNLLADHSQGLVPRSCFSLLFAMLIGWVLPVVQVIFTVLMDRISRRIAPTRFAKLRPRTSAADTAGQ